PGVQDRSAAEQIRDGIAPGAGEQRCAGGLEAAGAAVLAGMGGGPPPKSAARRAPPGLSPAAIALLGLIFGVFAVAVLAAIRNAQGRGYTVDRRGWSSQPPIVWGGGGGGGSWSGGGGGGGSSGGGGGSVR